MLQRFGSVLLYTCSPSTAAHDELAAGTHTGRHPWGRMLHDADKAAQYYTAQEDLMDGVSNSARVALWVPNAPP